MWKLIILTTFLLGCKANTHSSIKPIPIMAKINNSASICDNPPPTIEPEMCCDLPNFFNETIVEKCEMEFALAEKSSSNLITDSVKVYFN